MKSKVACSLFFGFILFSLQCFADDLPNYVQVNAGIGRGGRPTDNGLKTLHDQSVKTILNIENSSGAIKHEKQIADSYKMTFVVSEMDPLWAPSDEQADALLALLKDKNNYPIYIHCLHGQDRTGLIIGLYRVLVEGWTPEAAYQEMLKLNFHTRYIAMLNYFKKRTGYHEATTPAEYTEPRH